MADSPRISRSVIAHDKLSQSGDHANYSQDDPMKIHIYQKVCFTISASYTSRQTDLISLGD